MTFDELQKLDARAKNETRLADQLLAQRDAFVSQRTYMTSASDFITWRANRARASYPSAAEQTAMQFLDEAMMLFIPHVLGLAEVQLDAEARTHLAAAAAANAQLARYLDTQEKKEADQ